MTQNLKDLLIKIWVIVSVLLISGVAFFIMGYIIVNGWKVINLEFLLSSPKGVPLGKEGGIFPAIMGSLALGGLSMLLASILGIATAIYLNLYCVSQRIYSFISLVVQCIAGIPSIVLGLFGYTLFVVTMGIGYSLLAGALTLALMIFPVVTINTEKALVEFSKEQALASYALGISKSYTFFHIIWPECKKDILSGIILGTAYAMGATSPIMLTSAVLSASTPKSLFRPVMALPYHLYILSTERISIENAYGTAMVLLIILFIAYSIIFLFFKERKVDK